MRFDQSNGFWFLNNRIFTNKGSIIATHVLVLFLAVFSRTLKQEQKRILSRPVQHDCSRGGFRGGGDWVASHTHFEKQKKKLNMVVNIVAEMKGNTLNRYLIKTSTL